MTFIGWVFLLLIVWALVAGLFSFAISFYGGLVGNAKLGASTVSDLLGKRHLAHLCKESESLINLEMNLKGEDVDRTKLKNYKPMIYSPGPLEDATYEEAIPNLFRRVGSAVEIDINIEDVRELAQFDRYPSSELLQGINESQAPKFPHPPLPAPRPVIKPLEPTPWVCEESAYEVTKPLYSGVFKPPNYFVEKSFKKLLSKLIGSKKRESEAIEKAAQRNKEIEQLYQDALQRYEKYLDLEHFMMYSLE